MKHISLLRGVAGVISCLMFFGARADHEDLVPSIVTGTPLGYQIAFSDSNPYDCFNPAAGDDLNYLPPDIAFDMSLALESSAPSSPGSPPGYHAGYVNLGFRAPNFDGHEPPDDGPQVHVYDCAPGGPHDDDDCDNGAAPSDAILMPSNVYCMSTERNVRRVMGHELFHHVQDAYIESDNWLDWGRSAVEGSARMMEDMIFADIDSDPAMGFRGEANNYLANPGRDWWRLDYETALGWKHMTERFGTTADEPQLGVDFMRRFWDNAKIATDNDAVDFPATLAKTLAEASPGMTFGKWFADFAVTNVAREFDTSLIPDGGDYQYIDEQGPTGVKLGKVARVWTGDIPGFTIGNTQLARWGAAYAQANILQQCKTERAFVGWRSEGDHKGYAVLAVDGSGQVRQMIRGAGKINNVAFIQRSGNETYDKLIAVLIGGDDYASVNWQFDCGIGNVQVQRPDAAYKAYVGPAENPRTFIVRLRITGPASLGDPTVLGLQPNDFEVYVGNNFVFSDEALVITGLYVQGEYWLVVQAPGKPDTNTYDLHVNLGTLFDSSPGAVSYETRIYDQMLTLDTSGSMADPAASPSIEAAVNAASLFADVARTGDKLGLVTFAGDNIEPGPDATLQISIDDVTDAQRAAIQSRLAALVADGYTSIGDGLNVALVNMLANGSALGEDWIVLLSDGMENEALNWSDVEATIKLSGIRVNTIALGPDADQILLQNIAQETDGDYYYVDTGTLAARAQAGAGSVANRLADIYAVSSERIKDHQRLWEVSGRVAPAVTDSYELDVQEGGIREATFSINWDDSSDAAAVTIRRPGGAEVVDGVAGARIHRTDTHSSIHVGTLTAGTWSVEVRGSVGTTDYVGMLAGLDTQGASLELYFAQYIDEPYAQGLGAYFLRGLEQPIRAILFDNVGTIADASVRAAVEHPDGSVIDLPLYDDGGHGDGNSGDGIYANFYTRTTAASQTDLQDVVGLGVRGSYNVVVNASGKDNRGQTFTRIRKQSFNIFESDDPAPDSELDGMPDLYENLHACLDAFDDEADLDADEDRISNREEWQIGTDPCHADTDRGGESDFSEVSRGANPFDPVDDALPRPRDVEVIDWRLDHLDFPAGSLLPNANWIRYPVNTAYNRIHIWRSTSADGPFAEVAVFDAAGQGGQYHDMGLVNGTTYYYKVQPDDLNDNLGAPSHVFSGTPKADPIPPIGSIRINDGAAVTPAPVVRLSLMANGDATHMRIGNNTLDGAGWQPYTAQTMWPTLPDPQTGLATVLAQFRDAAFNVTSVYHASIVVDSNGISATILGTAQLEGATVHNLVVARIAGQSNAQIDFSSVSGSFALPGLSAGTYDVQLSHPGYESVVIHDVSVAAGANFHLGTWVLPALDADADGVFDLVDNCTLTANPDQRDTNADGIGNACDADINNDCAVNFGDLAALKAAFIPNPYNPDVDFDGDGFVNFGDLAFMKSTFFNSPDPGPGPGSPTNPCH